MEENKKRQTLSEIFEDVESNRIDEKFGISNAKEMVPRIIADAIKSGNKTPDFTNKELLRKIKITSTFESFFEGAKNMVINLTSWNAEDLSHMFSSSKVKADLKNWDVSNVSDFSHMLEKTCTIDSDISNWDVGNAITLNRMFLENDIFKGDLQPWAKKFRLLKSVGGMFEASSYDGDLSSWESVLKRLKVKDVDIMFKRTKRSFVPGIVKALDKKVDNLANAVGDLDGAIDVTVRDAKKIAKKVGGVLGKAASSVGASVGTLASFF